MPHREGHEDWSDRDWRREWDRNRYREDDRSYDPRSSLRQYRDWENEEGWERGDWGRGRQSSGSNRPSRGSGYGYESDYDTGRYEDRGYDRGWNRRRQDTERGRRSMLSGRYNEGWDQGYNRGSYGQDYEEDWDTGPTWTYVETWWIVPGPYEGVGPKGYQRSDERIKEEVCERLTQHGRIDASEIDIEVNDGEVTLSGNVHRRQDKRLAEDLAESVSGVNDVHNQLRIRDIGREHDMLIGRGIGDERRTDTQPSWPTGTQAGTQTGTPSGAQTSAQTSAQTGIQSGAQAGMRSQIREGMDVLGRDGEKIGTVKEVGNSEFLVDRSMERDVYVPFSACSSASGGQVRLNVRADEVNQQNWRAPEILGGS